MWVSCYQARSPAWTDLAATAQGEVVIERPLALVGGADRDVARDPAHEVAGLVIDEALQAPVVGDDGGPAVGDRAVGDLVVVDDDRAARRPLRPVRGRHCDEEA